MSEELKGCPFCGGEVAVAIGGDDVEQFYFITRGNGENKCTCRAFMESEKFSVDIGISEKEKVMQELINSWNRRVCRCRQKEKSK